MIEVEASPAEGTTPSGSYYNYQTIGAINAAIAALNTAIGKCVRQVNGKDPDANGNVAVNIGVSSINNRTGVVQLPINAFAGCTTAADVASKEVAAVAGFSPLEGAVLAVRFLHDNTAENVRLNYGGTELIVSQMNELPQEILQPECTDLCGGGRTGSCWINSTTPRTR